MPLAPVSAQEPDTVQVQPDTVQVTPDTAGVDTVQVVPDSLVADSLAAADSVMPVDTFPAFPRGHASGFEQSVWEWDPAMLASNRAITLLELVTQIPGLIGLRGGDYGTPMAVTAFGGAAGGVRVFLDGFELLPLDGTVPDLSRISLAGLERVRVARDATELRIDVTTQQPLEPDPNTRVDVGTGDLGTNVLRATFVHPNTLGGALSFALDRVETRGPTLEQGGATNGVAVRYGIHYGTRGGLAAELRRSDTSTEVVGLPTGLVRTDWNVRGRWSLTPGLLVDGVWGRSALKGSEEDQVYGPIERSRSQGVLRLGYERSGVWASATGRRTEGDGLPDWGLEGGAGFDLGGYLQAQGRYTREYWEDETTSAYVARASTRPFWGLSVFGSYESGKRGMPFAGEVEEVRRLQAERDSIAAADTTGAEPPPDQEPLEMPSLRLTDRSARRVGARLQWRDFSVSGAMLSMEADSLRPTGLILDRTGPTLPGGERTGFEVAAHVPIWRGWALDAAYQQWDEDWAYLPGATWDGEINYHGIFKESRNLEVWFAAGVNGRDPMSLRLIDPEPEDPPLEGPALVQMPFYQDWYGFVQVRIVTVSVFVRWENLAGKDDNFDFPERTTPKFRTLYGIRWVLRN